MAASFGVVIASYSEDTLRWMEHDGRKLIGLEPDSEPRALLNGI